MDRQLDPKSKIGRKDRFHRGFSFSQFEIIKALSGTCYDEHSSSQYLSTSAGSNKRPFLENVGLVQIDFSLNALGVLLWTTLSARISEAKSPNNARNNERYFHIVGLIKSMLLRQLSFLQI